MRITKVFAEGWWPIKGAILALRRLKCLSVGFTANDGAFHTLAFLNISGVWLGPYKVDADRVGPEQLLEFKKQANGFADFYRPDQLTTKHNSGCAGKFQKLEPVAAKFAAFLNGFRATLTELSETVE